MDIRKISSTISIAPQFEIDDVKELSSLGFKSIISGRPDGEETAQVKAQDIGLAANGAGMEFCHVPVKMSDISDQDIAVFKAAVDDLPKPILAFCRSGTRAAALWALSQAPEIGADKALAVTKSAGYDLSEALQTRLAKMKSFDGPSSSSTCDVLVVGAGAAGIATAASLLKRRKSLNIVIIDPSEEHAYQPGWTMVGGGIFKPGSTVRQMASVIPEGVKWEKASVAEFDPDHDCVVLDDGRRISYRTMVAAPGIKLNWSAIEGLDETLGRNGVTSNYSFETAPYTWSLVQGLKGGKAIFTQPPMPIKCAGAPQKAMYLSGDYWFRKGRISDISIEFHNAGQVLFGVREYVPALMEYVRKYRANLNFGSKLIAVDGERKEARFAVTGLDGLVVEETRGFDMIHVCPPQVSPDFVRASPLANAAGWI